MTTEYIQIGKLVATHGINGTLILAHGVGEKLKAEASTRIKALFIEPVKGVYIPYFVQKISIRKPGEWLLQLEGVESKEAAKLLTRKNVWLPRKDFDSLVDGFQPISLIGYTVVNQGQKLSEVEEVIEQPHQILLRLTYQGKEVLIPLHAETLKKVDPERRSVHVELPAGLLEIYLEA